jgi:hypothetical protein
MIDYVDLVSRLRNWTISRTAVPCGDLMDEAAAGIEALVANRNHWMGAARAFDEHLATMRVMLMEQPGVRFGAAESRETVQCPYVTGDTTKYCTLTTFTLTDEERESISYYLGTGGPYAVHATLSGLLSRTGTDGEKTADDAAECHSQSEKTPERERITDAEREAVEWFARHSNHGMSMRRAATLRGLLERIGGER